MAARCQEQSLREDLTCAICCELFSDPVMLECMHHFCKACIQGYWGRCPRVASCPQCRREFPSRTFRTHYLVSGVVEKVRKCSSEDHKRKTQECLEDALRVHRKEMENFVRMKHAAEKGICSLTTNTAFPLERGMARDILNATKEKTSGELNSKIRTEFIRLHQILEEEERVVLMELTKEEEQLFFRLRGDITRLEEGISELGKNIERIQEILNKKGDLLLLEVENLALRPPVHVEAQLPPDIERHRDQYSGPLQYIFWRRMLQSIHPAPAPLTFDPKSAHPNLILSKDLTAVTESTRRQPVYHSPKRFQQCVNVLGSETFDSGSHYWEVWVGSKTKWDLGVAAESVDRAAKVKLCPENGYWALRLRNGMEYWAAATPWVRLAPRSCVQKVGVFLDCSERKVAFYNAEDMAHLFTFHQAAARRFCPFFSTCFSDGKSNMEPMRICHLTL